MARVPSRLPLAGLIEESVFPGCVLALGGLHFHNTPMAAVREIIRQRIRIGCLVPAVAGSLNADLLIGAGLVDEIMAAYVGLENYGMAPRFRAAAESQQLRIREVEEVGILWGLQAGSSGQPYIALPPGLLPEDQDSPTVVSVNTEDYKKVVDPFTGVSHYVVRAIVPDVSILQCQAIDAAGNGGYYGSAFFDLPTARAAKKCIVIADEEVEELPARCREYLPSFLISDYSVGMGTAHPASSHGLYAHDGAAIASYAANAQSDQWFATYLSDVVGASEDDYCASVQLIDRLAALKEDPADG